MMSRSRKVLGILPFVVSAVWQEKLQLSFFQTLIGSSFLWIPYWLAWWLSDGFAEIKFVGTYVPYDIGYRFGPQGYGYYHGHFRIF